MSLVLYALMWRDKRAARTNRRRSRERVLLLLAWAGGAPGGWIAMQRLRHKTRHLRFRILLPILSILWMTLVIVLSWRGFPVFPYGSGM